MNNSILEQLGIIPPSGDSRDYEPEEIVRPERGELVVDPISSNTQEIENSDAQQDYLNARNNLYAMIKMTGDMSFVAMHVAKETEHPRSFEAFNSLITSMRTLNKDLIDMHKTMKEVYRGAAIKQTKDANEKKEVESTTYSIDTATLLRQTEESMSQNVEPEED